MIALGQRANRPRGATLRLPSELDVAKSHSLHGKGMAPHDYTEILKRIPFFDAMEPQALRSLVFAGETRLLCAGETLFRCGDSSDCAFVPTSGSIAFESDAGRPADKIVRSPALLGETALVAATERAITAIAANPRHY